MSFKTTDIEGQQWTHSDSRMGGRRQVVKKGVYVIDHRATGRFIMGSSNDVSKEVDRHLALLAKGKHPIKILQTNYTEEIYRADPDEKMTIAPMVIIEYDLNSDKAIKLVLKEIRETNTAPYCLLN